MAWNDDSDRKATQVGVLPGYSTGNLDAAIGPAVNLLPGTSDIGEPMESCRRPALLALDPSAASNEPTPGSAATCGPDGQAAARRSTTCGPHDRPTAGHGTAACTDR